MEINKHKWSTNLIPFGVTADRFNPSGYRADIDTKEKIILARQIEGLDGVEIHYPTMFKNDSPESIKLFLNQQKLECSIVSPALSGNGVWKHGSLSNSDAGARREAIQCVKDAMDASVVLGARRLNIWLGQDGFDYPFQNNYLDNWNNLVDSLGECASHNSQVRLCLESKLKQPRAYSLLGTVAKVLLVIQTVNMENVGCLFDTGHAFFAHENLGENVSLLIKFGKLFHLHFNDNYGDWDWDMVVGSVHSYEFIEMLFWINRLGYDGWYSLDQFPQREDPVEALAASIQIVNRMEEVLAQLDSEEIYNCIQRHDHLTLLQRVEGVRSDRFTS